MGELHERARVFRSKNAGPFLATVDIMMPSDEAYQEAIRSPSLQPRAIADVYGVLEGDVRVFFFPQAHAIKIVLPRSVSSGAVGDRDVYGAQQHVPLAELAGQAL
jgi:hypothetical protein